MALVIRSSKIHAAGCYTTTPVSKGAHIVEYTGPRLTVEEIDTRSSDRPETYLFGLSDGQHVIDGDGIAAFINHCCDPNCEADEIDGRVWIIALRDIAAAAAPRIVAAASIRRKNLPNAPRELLPPRLPAPNRPASKPRKRSNS